MGELVLPITFGVTSVALLAVSAGVGAAWRSATARVSSLTEQLEDSEARNTATSASVDDLTAQVDRLEAKLTEADQRAEALVSDKEQLAEQLERARAELTTAESTARDAAASSQKTWREQRTSLQRDLDRALAEVQTARRTITGYGDQLQRAEALLAAVGIERTEQRDPLTRDNRPASRAALRQLLVCTGAEAVALTSGSGLLQLGAGRDASQQRIGVASAIVSEMQLALSAILCAPIAAISVTGPRFVQHLLKAPGRDVFVGLENTSDAPLFALQHARLALFGERQAPPTITRLPSFELDLDNQPDATLGRLLVEWAGRWGARSAIVISAEAEPVAATPSADAGPAVHLYEQIQGLVRRATRDRMPLDAVGLSATSADGTTVQIVLVPHNGATAAIVSVAGAAIPDRALDELRSSVRWHLSSHAPLTREAS